MSKHQLLLAFAAETLRVLEAHEEWDSDTTDEIGNYAIQLGLAAADEDSLFRADPEALAAATVAQANDTSEA